MTDLRKQARGRPCMVRAPGVCSHNPETTVLAHIRIAGISGIGIKPPDLIGTWACHSCHDLIDRRSNTDMERDYVMLLALQGMARTINVLIKEGIVCP